MIIGEKYYFLPMKYKSSVAISSFIIFNNEIVKTNIIANIITGTCCLKLIFTSSLLMITKIKREKIRKRQSKVCRFGKFRAVE